MAREIYATDANELGLPSIHSYSGRRLHCNSLDIRTVPAASICKIYRNGEDIHHAEAEAAEAIQTCAGGDACTTVINLLYTREALEMYIESKLRKTLILRSF